jgi:hypothetical protein
MKKFSILINTRNRVKLLSQSLKSLSVNTKDKSSLEVLIAVDKDDLNSINYINRSIIKFDFLIKMIISQRGAGYKDNPKRLKKLIRISSGEVFFYFADDFLMNTKNWDVQLNKQINSLPNDGIYLLTAKHNQKNKNWPLCQIISRKWYNVTKKFSNCYETDTELMIISTSIKRYFICNKLKIKINHISRNDLTFKEGRKKLLDTVNYDGSVNSLKGFIKVLIDLNKINVILYEYNNVQSLISLIKVFFFTSIKIIFKFRINILRSLY